jgi:hypothetical protein
LNRDLGQSHKMIDKLLSISEYWRFLEWEPLLPLLDDFDSTQAFEMQSPPASRAEILLGYMASYKVRQDIKVWTTDNLNILRHSLFKVRQGTRCHAPCGKTARQSKVRDYTHMPNTSSFWRFASLPVYHESEMWNASSISKLRA